MFEDTILDKFQALQVTVVRCKARHVFADGFTKTLQRCFVEIPIVVIHHVKAQPTRVLVFKTLKSFASNTVFKSQILNLPYLSPGFFKQLAVRVLCGFREIESRRGIERKFNALQCVVLEVVDDKDLRSINRRFNDSIGNSMGPPLLSRPFQSVLKANETNETNETCQPSTTQEEPLEAIDLDGFTN